MAIEYIYNARGKPVGFRYGGFIHDMTGRPIGQVSGTHVHKMSGQYVGELHIDMIVDEHLGNPGNIGNPGNPGNAGSPGNPGDRGTVNYGFPDVFEGLLGLARTPRASARASNWGQHWGQHARITGRRKKQTLASFI